ncbi:MAG: O-antigen ligase family protein [bacterium]|nr:O-antigen ligase family protein [bacterium]
MKLVARGVNPVLIPLYVLVLGLFLLPILYSIKPNVNYELVKVYFFQRWVEVFCLSVVIFTPDRIRFKKISHFGSVILLIAFFGIALFTSYFGADYSRSFWGNSFRGDGLLTLFHGVLLFVFVQISWRDYWKKYLTYTLIAASIVASAFALGHGKNYGTLGHTVFLGGYLLLTLPFFITAKNKVRFLDLIPIPAIVFSGSRFAILGMILMHVVWLISRCVKLTHIGSGIRSHIGKWLFVCYLIFSVFYFGYYGYKVITISEDYRVGNTIVYEDRLRIYTKGFLGFLDRPLLGYGFANFDKAFEAVDWPARIPKDVYVDKAHSIWLEVLTTTGIAGFIFYLLFSFLLFIKLKWHDQFSKAVTLSLIFYLINAQVNVTSVAQDALFWVFAGIVVRE